MTEAYVYDATRCAVGKQGGALADTRPDELAAEVLDGLAERADVDPADIEDVVMGCVTQVDEQGGNIGRMAPLIAGWPVETTGTTVNRMCGSSLQTVNFAAQSVMSGMHDLVVGAGVESMTRVPMGSDMGPISDQLRDRFDIVQQGISADLIAQKWEIPRERLDRLALESHERAIEAIDEGRFDREIHPVEVETPEGETITFETDEGPRRDTNLDTISSLDPVFKDDGVITPATSSQISDGASAVLLGNRETGDELGLEPRARIEATAVAGVDPTIMLTGPIPATQQVLDKADLELDDIDLFEVNEAFASVVWAWAEETADDPESLLERTNVNGGAMALGHPLGATGAKLLTTLLHEMERRDVRYGLVTLCIGFGQAVATIIDRDV
jgi:acetyl-CoA acetyltransferase family protein